LQQAREGIVHQLQVQADGHNVPTRVPSKQHPRPLEEGLVQHVHVHHKDQPEDVWGAAQTKKTEGWSFGGGKSQTQSRHQRENLNLNVL